MSPTTTRSAAREAGSLRASTPLPISGRPRSRSGSTAGQAGDNPQLVALFFDDYGGASRDRGVSGRDFRLLGDKAYSHPSTRTELRSRRVKHTIPERKDQIARRRANGSAGGRPPAFDAAPYGLRNTVERGFNRLKQWRGVASRYDKYALTYLGGVLLACAVIHARVGANELDRCPSRAARSADDDLPQVLADTVTDFLGKPRARGWIHLCSAASAIVAGAALVSVAWIAASPKAGWATLIYAAAIVAMFSVSATYHRVHWRSPAAEMWMRRADHSLIFVLIAGSYTPIALLAMPPRTGTQILTVVCTGAAAGVALKMLWPSAPRWLGVPLYLTARLGGDLVHRNALGQRGCRGRRATRRRRCALQHRRYLLRPLLAQPVATDLRLSRVLSCVHRGRGDLPLHRRLGRRLVTTFRLPSAAVCIAGRAALGIECSNPPT